MRKRRRRAGTVIVLLLLALVAGCGEEDEQAGSAQPQGLESRLTLGTKNFTEEFILGSTSRRSPPRVTTSDFGRTSAPPR